MWEGCFGVRICTSHVGIPKIRIMSHNRRDLGMSLCRSTGDWLTEIPFCVSIWGEGPNQHCALVRPAKQGASGWVKVPAS